MLVLEEKKLNCIKQKIERKNVTKTCKILFESLREGNNLP